MRQLRLLPLVAFGAFLYVLGIALVIAPFAFDFAEDSGATLASIVLGVLVLTVALLARGPASAANLVPELLAEGAGYVAGVALLLFPFIFDRAGSDEGDTLAYVAAGALTFVVTLATRFPRKRGADAGRSAGAAPGPATAGRGDARPGSIDVTPPGDPTNPAGTPTPGANDPAP